MDLIAAINCARQELQDRVALSLETMMLSPAYDDYMEMAQVSSEQEKRERFKKVLVDALTFEDNNSRRLAAQDI